jgi:hypothetical protein
MLRGPLHNRGADGLCEACGEPFPCPDGIAIFEAVKRELEHPSPLPPQKPEPEPEPEPPPIEQPPRPRWEDLDDREARCPRCLHWWVSHGVPGEDGYACSISTSSMDDRVRGIFKTCACTFAEGNTVTPRQVRSWSDGTSFPTPPWARGHS